jgi:DnaJ-domain-containing protein 1
MRTLANIYDCMSVAGDTTNDHTNNDILDNLIAFVSIIIIGLILLALYDSSFSFSHEYFSSKLGLIVEETPNTNKSIFTNLNAAGLLGGICTGELGRLILEKYKSPLQDLYFGRFDTARPETPHQINFTAAADICTLLMDIDLRTIKMVEVAIGTEFRLNPLDREFVAGKLKQGRNGLGSHPAILRPINKLYGKNSAGGRAFFERLVRVCMTAGFRNDKTADRLKLVASNLGISQIEAAEILRRLQFTVEDARQRTYSEYRGTGNRGSSSHTSSSAQTQQTGAASTRAHHLTILGLRGDASNKKVKSAYRKFAKIYHPDVLQSKNLTPLEMQAASAKMAEINMAYDWLMTA